MVSELKSKSNIHWQFMVFVLIATMMCSCAANINIIPSQIKSSEDAIIIGRVRLISRGIGAPSLAFYLALSYELKNITDGSSSTLHLFGEFSFQKTWKGDNEGYGKPIFRTAIPGDYVFGALIVSGPDRGQFIPFVRFKVTKGKLVYFGTIELNVRIHKPYILGDTSFYLEEHKVVNEFEKTMNLFREEFPQIYEMYKQNVEIVPQRSQ